MKRKLKSHKGQRKDQSTEKKFTTMEEVSSYLFPKSVPEKEPAKGRERGTKAAEHAFTEISKALQI